MWRPLASEEAGAALLAAVTLSSLVPATPCQHVGEKRRGSCAGLMAVFSGIIGGDGNLHRILY